MKQIICETLERQLADEHLSGNASFTLLKGDDGLPIMTPHSQALTIYNLTVSTTASPTDIACTVS